jgi:hypothetical protein
VPLEAGRGIAGQGQFLTRIVAHSQALLDLATSLALHTLWGMSVSTGGQRRSGYAPSLSITLFRPEEEGVSWHAADSSVLSGC